MIALTNSDFGRINNLTKDTFSFERTIWDRLSIDSRLSYVFFIPYDSRGLQLLIKDLLPALTIKFTFYKTLKIVNFLRKAKYQLGILHRYQIQYYKKHQFFIVSRICCLCTQTTLFTFVASTKSASKFNIDNLEAKFLFWQNKTLNHTKINVLNPNFETDLDMLITISSVIHEYQKT